MRLFVPNALLLTLQQILILSRKGFAVPLDLQHNVLAHVLQRLPYCFCIVSALFLMLLDGVCLLGVPAVVCAATTIPTQASLRNTCRPPCPLRT